ncbi:hypothetical protein ACFWA9_10340 [Kitasatospora sp. NPDC059973]|uniref:hypothetical protein n=1 Tax=Kitasatospora sp. NPDC059973 TaxID=3347020 RepID=UPI00368CAC4A
MATRSHLSSAPEQAADESTPEEKFARLTRAVYGDRRADPPARELLLAVAFASTLGKVADEKMWTTVRRALGGRPARLRELARLDLPRYVEPGAESWVEGTCEAARHRAFVPRATGGHTRAQAAEDWRNTDHVCGSSGTMRVTERDLATGRHLLHWFCGRHREQAARVAEQLAEQNKRAPEPVPNAGGLLPSYFAADWLTFYRWASWLAWQPPSYGVCADDWPAAEHPVPAHPRLRLIPGDVAESAGQP